MAYGDVVGMSSESASFSNGETSSYDRCKKSTFVKGTLTPSWIGPSPGGTVPATTNLDMTAESSCDCDPDEEMDPCRSIREEVGSSTKAYCRIEGYGSDGTPIESCVIGSISRAPRGGVSPRFCATMAGDPEDMGTCDNPPVDDVTCNCESNPPRKRGVMSVNTAKLIGGAGTQYLGQIIARGMPRRLMDEVDCGECNAP